MVALRVAFVSLALMWAGPAWATYSIVAVDSATGQVGGAAASCLPAGQVRMIFGAAPGRGAIASQADTNLDARDLGVTLLYQGLDAEAIVDALTDPVFDLEARRRQYGVVTLPGMAAGWTGTWPGEYRGDVQGRVDETTYALQGNLLTGKGVLDQAEQAFVSGGCDLADRLMRALVAGAENQQGDRRCSPRGTPASTAFVQVDSSDQASGAYLAISLSVSDQDDPLIELRKEFAAWRSTHPCPATIVSMPGGDAGTNTDAGSDTGAGAPVRDSSTGDVLAVVDRDVAFPGPSVDGAPLDSSSGASNPGGCSCAVFAPAPRSGRAPFALPALVMALARRRRRAH